MLIHVFPDLEAVLIKQFQARLEQMGLNVRVGVMRQPGALEIFEAEMTVGDDGGTPLNAALRDHSFRVNIWANDWAKANEVAYLVEALVPTLQAGSSGAIQTAEVITSVQRVEDPTGEQMRNLTGSAIVRASTRTI